MSDRLDELRRQRALLDQHLAWLDREIAAEAAKTAVPQLANQQTVIAPARSIATDSAPAAATIATTVNVVNPVLVPARPASPATPSPAEAEALLDKYRVAPESLKQNLRKGCFLYFALALALLIVGVAILYFALSKP